MTETIKAEVIRLTGAGPVWEPDEEIVQMIEALLAEAKRGEVKGFGFFVVTGADGVSTQWIPGCASADQMVAGAARLQFRVLKAAAS